MIFTSGDEVRDSSTAAIAVCGLTEFLPYVQDEKLKRIYKNAADQSLKSLIDNYTTNGMHSNGILKHGVYAKPNNRGVDECVIWGDYYYMEALVRYRGNWNKYW